MTKPIKSIFVLWDALFDEALAVDFITQLRNVGLRVKLVGIYGRPQVGIRGMTLTPDLTLSQAISQIEKCCYMIIPCGSPPLKKLEQNQGLHTFYRKAAYTDIQFVIGLLLEGDIQGAPLFANLPKLQVLHSKEDVQRVIDEISSTVGSYGGEQNG
ncbi:MAG: hypothetical protein AAF702_51050 [Chloroflexota bacterium]